MTLSEEAQKRIWILATKVFNNDDNFDFYTNKVYLLFKVFYEQSCKNNLKNDEEKTLEKVKKIIEDIKVQRMHDKIRTQDNNNSFKIKCDDMLAKIITLINPEIMLNIPIQELGE